MSNLWYPNVKQSPLRGYTGFGGGAAGLAVHSGGLSGDPWTNDKPSWVDSSFDNLRPYFWADFENRNGSNGLSGTTMLDRSGNGRNANTRGTENNSLVTMSLTNTNGGGTEGLNTTSRKMLQGSWHSNSVVINDSNGGGWPNTSGTNGISMITLSAYASGGDSDRLWTGGSGINWLLGHWSDQTGVAYYNDGFIGGNSNSPTAQGHKFFISYGHYESSSSYLYAHRYYGSNTVEYTTGGGTANWPNSTQGISINKGNHDEWSDWRLLMVGIWDMVLTSSLRTQIIDDVYQEYMN
tara:strand:+ start:138 stop:1019 length:882 start_codon:yes stop_codon:yes gene_type:complete